MFHQEGTGLRVHPSGTLLAGPLIARCQSKEEGRRGTGRRGGKGPHD